MGIASEQLYCLIMGICRVYGAIHKKPIRKKIDVDCLLPLLDYRARTKVYAIENYVHKDIDPLAKEIINIIESTLRNPKNYKLNPGWAKAIKNKNMVPMSFIYRRISNNKNLRKWLFADKDNKNVSLRVFGIARGLAESGVLTYEKVGRMELFGFTKKTQKERNF